MSIPVEISFYETNIGILYQLFIRLFDSNGVFNDLLVMLIQIVYLNFIRCNYDAKYVGWELAPQDLINPYLLQSV